MTPASCHDTSVATPPPSLPPVWELQHAPHVLCITRASSHTKTPRSPESRTTAALTPIALLDRSLSPRQPRSLYVHRDQRQHVC